jgi:hypothetical protein
LLVPSSSLSPLSRRQRHIVSSRPTTYFSASPRLFIANTDTNAPPSRVDTSTSCLSAVEVLVALARPATTTTLALVPVLSAEAQTMLVSHLCFFLPPFFPSSSAPSARYTRPATILDVYQAHDPQPPALTTALSSPRLWSKHNDRIRWSSCAHLEYVWRLDQHTRWLWRRYVSVPVSAFCTLTSRPATAIHPVLQIFMPISLFYSLLGTQFPTCATFQSSTLYAY